MQATRLHNPQMTRALGSSEATRAEQDASAASARPSAVEAKALEVLTGVLKEGAEGAWSNGQRNVQNATESCAQAQLTTPLTL